MHWKSFNSPGCRSGAGFGGTHCSYSEIQDCIDKDLINLNDFEDNYFLQSYPRRNRPEYLDMSAKNFTEIKYLTIIRHPVTRVLSEYYWWLDKCSNAWPRSLCMVGKNSLEAWIKHPQNTAHNRQTKSLISLEDKGDTGSSWDYGKESGTTNKCSNLNAALDITKYSSKPEYKTQNISLAETAIKNLEQNFMYVAIYEKIHLSKDLSQIIFRYRDKNQVRLNRSRYKRAVAHSTELKRPVDFPLSLLEEIYERNRLDMAVYDYFNRKLEVSVDHYSV